MTAKSQKEAKPKEMVVGTFRETREELPNGVTRETRVEKRITLKRNPGRA